jgi:hypothetical protein
MSSLRKLTWFLVLLALVVGPSQVLAQEGQTTQSCPQIVQNAFRLTNQLCEAAGRNEACYGHVQVNALLASGTDPGAFAQEGDILDLVKLRSLRLSPMDFETGSWGVSLMRVQANIPDTQSSTNLTFLAFGDVEITNAAPDAALLRVRAATRYANVNVHQFPFMDALVIGTLSPGQQAIASGRLEDGSWYRIFFSDTGETGWVHRSVIRSSEDLSQLDVVEGTSAYYRPLQAFYFRSAENDAPCAEAPNSGLLIQTPEGVAEVKLLINEIGIRLGSTAFVQANQDDGFTLNLLEGHAQIEVDGVEQTAFPGTQVNVPLDEGGHPQGPPSEPQPYDSNTLQTLPTTDLQRPVNVPPALSEDQVDTLMTVEAAQATAEVSPTPVVAATEDVPGSNVSMLDEGTVTPTPDGSVTPTPMSDATQTATDTVAAPPSDTPTSVPPTLTPSNVPTLPPATAVPTPTQPMPPTTTVVFQRLRLSALCTPDVASVRMWQVTNPNAYDVIFRWQLYGSLIGQAGTLVAPANGQTTFRTLNEEGVDTVVIYVDGVLNDNKTASAQPCDVPPTAVPAPTNTPLPPTSTWTNTPAPTNTPVPTSTRTNTPAPTNTPVPTNTTTNTPAPPATNTLVPTALPTATRTFTPVPPTVPPTATPTLVPPTATPVPSATYTPIGADTPATATPRPPSSSAATPTPTGSATVTVAAGN